MGKGDKKSKKGKIFQHSYGKSRLRKKQLRKKLRSRIVGKTTTLGEKSQVAQTAAGKPIFSGETKQEIKSEIKMKAAPPAKVESAEVKPAVEEVKKSNTVSEMEPKQDKNIQSVTIPKGKPRKKKEE